MISRDDQAEAVKTLNQVAMQTKVFLFDEVYILEYQAIGTLKIPDSLALNDLLAIHQARMGYAFIIANKPYKAVERFNQAVSYFVNRVPKDDITPEQQIFFAQAAYTCGLILTKRLNNRSESIRLYLLAIEMIKGIKLESRTKEDDAFLMSYLVEIANAKFGLGEIKDLKEYNSIVEKYARDNNLPPILKEVVNDIKYRSEADKATLLIESLSKAFKFSDFLQQSIQKVHNSTDQIKTEDFNSSNRLTK